MANKIDRKLVEVYAGNSPIKDVQTKDGFPTKDVSLLQDTNYIQGLRTFLTTDGIMPSFESGWNAALYVLSNQIKYATDRGISEYDPDTEYFIGDIARGVGTSFIYKSLVDNNIGNALTSASWLLCGDLANGLVNDNLADNGDFIIAQRGTFFTSATTFTNNDGNYTLDRYKVGNSAGTTGVINVSQITNPVDLPDGARAAISLLHQQADKQAYIAQYYDNDTTKTLLNKDVSLSFDIYNSDSVTRNFRAAVLSWQGTADNMPFYPVTTWQTANDLIFDGNFTIENTTTTLTANATSWNRFTINGVNIDTADTNNLAIAIWTDETMSNGYEWRVTKVKLEQSSIATAWKAKSITTEGKVCKYFYETFNYGRQFGLWHTFVGNGDTRGRLEYQTKRITPTITLPTTLANCFATGETGSATNLSVNIIPSDIADNFCNIDVTNATVFSGLGSGVIWSTNVPVLMQINADL